MYHAPLSLPSSLGGSPVAPCPWSTRRGGDAGERGTRRGSSRPPPSRAWCPCGATRWPAVRSTSTMRRLCSQSRCRSLQSAWRARGVLWFSLVPACLQRAGCGIGPGSRLLCGRGGRARIGGTALRASSISRLAANCSGQIGAIARKRQGLAVRLAASQRAIGGKESAAQPLPYGFGRQRKNTPRHLTNTDGLH